MTKTTQTTGTKTCTKCGITKDINDFYKRGGKTSPNTRHNHCKECTKNRVAKTYWNDPSVYQNNHLKRNYGITLNEYNQMLTEQNNQCAVCHTTDPGGKHGKFVIDHCHSTNKIRGVLCNNCNTALGLVGDNVDTLHKMINYLGINSQV